MLRASSMSNLRSVRRAVCGRDISVLSGFAQLFRANAELPPRNGAAARQGRRGACPTRCSGGGRWAVCGSRRQDRLRSGNRCDRRLQRDDVRAQIPIRGHEPPHRPGPVVRAGQVKILLASTRGSGLEANLLILIRYTSGPFR